MVYCQQCTELATTYVTQSDETGFIVHVSRFDFSPKTQSYMNKLIPQSKSARLEWSGFHNQNQLDLSGLVLLTAFPNPSGYLYLQCGALMEL